MLRRVLLALSLCACAGCSAASYLWYRVAPDYPQQDSDTLSLPGLAAPVQVSFDEGGAPHLEAQSEHDLVRAVGYVHGRERFFQMDILRRYAQGRLAALVGDQPFGGVSTVASDRTMRGWGFAELARGDAARLAGEERTLLAAYDWQGVLDPTALPLARGDATAALAHANNLMLPAGTGPALVQVDTAPSYRLKHIRALLDATPRHDLDSFARIQGDRLSLRARRVLPVLLADLAALSSPSAAEQAAVALLSAWDGVASADSAAA